MRIPESIEELQGEVVFDENIHLELGEPQKIWSLQDFGHPADGLELSPFPLAVTAPFKVLSEEGVRALNTSIQLLMNKRRQSERMANFIRGAVFYSKFIRDLCQSEKLNQHISRLAGAPAEPHPMALYQAHINLKPEDEGREVDKWHTDTISLDFVLLCTDPSTFEGGDFEYFQCTKGQAIRSLIREEHEPHTIAVKFPQAGYAVLQQGNKVVHRASAVKKGKERTTLIQSFIPKAENFKDVSKLDDCRPVDPPEYLFTEWARYKAYLSQRRLNKLIKELPYTEDKILICNELRKAIRDVEEAVLEISDSSEGRLHHLGQDALTDLL